MDSAWIAMVMGALILVASVASVEAGISVALIEIVLGVIAANTFGLHTTPWMDFLASFASIVLTFLAGAEVDPDLMRERLKESHAVLPAFILGLAVARILQANREQQRRLRVVAFSLLTPFFFIRSGMNVSLKAVGANLGLTLGLLAVKLLTKAVGVYPPAKRYLAEGATYTTLLMSTGLTFGTISSLYGLNAGIITRDQFSVLVTVVVLSALVPTWIAQRFFHPNPSETKRRAETPAGAVPTGQPVRLAAEEE